MHGTLNENEPHPAAEGARQWLIGYIQRKDAFALMRLQESFASCAIEGNRLAEMCSETLRRLLNKEPVSDRYLLGLVWTIRDMEEQEKQDAESGLVKELAEALEDASSIINAIDNTNSAGHWIKRQQEALEYYDILIAKANPSSRAA